MMFNITLTVDKQTISSLDLDSKHTAVRVANMCLFAANYAFRFDLQDFKKDTKFMRWTAIDDKLSIEIRRL